MREDEVRGLVLSLYGGILSGVSRDDSAGGWVVRLRPGTYLVRESVADGHQVRLVGVNFETKEVVLVVPDTV